MELVTADRHLHELLDHQTPHEVMVAGSLASQPFEVWAEYWAHLAIEEGYDLGSDPVDPQAVELTTLRLQLLWEHEGDRRALFAALEAVDSAYPALGMAARGWLLTAV